MKYEVRSNNLLLGFTLIELLIVIAVIGVLVGLSAVNLVGIRGRGRDAQRKSDIQAIRSALELYRADAGCYPGVGTCPAMPACGSELVFGLATYMQAIPCEPLSTSPPYAYTPGIPTNGYTLTACLENVNDLDKDDTDGGPNDKCGVVGFPDRRVSYSQTNP